VGLRVVDLLLSSMDTWDIPPFAYVENVGHLEERPTLTKLLVDFLVSPIDDTISRVRIAFKPDNYDHLADLRLQSLTFVVKLAKSPNRSKSTRGITPCFDGSVTGFAPHFSCELKPTSG
jgi:hypothetical protein